MEPFSSRPYRPLLPVIGFELFGTQLENRIGVLFLRVLILFCLPQCADHELDLRRKVLNP